ncbi:MAG TPA: hypothetical protein VNL91_02860, partial [Thermoanaerobaculia bacterium]|nr:hypothetical protein [Thermoanaerobaculia bacterium]
MRVDPARRGRLVAERMLHLIAALALLAPPAALAEVRQISEVERAAVEMAADYLSRGTPAIVERLASNSPLRKSSDPAAEVEVRLGPPDGATWELQTVVPALADRLAVFAIEYPSGIDDTAMFELVREDGRYAIRDIRITAQRAMTSPKRVVTAAAVPASGESSAPKRRALILGLFAAAVAVGASFAMARNALAGRAAFAAAAGVAALGLFLGWKAAPLGGSSEPK